MKLIIAYIQPDTVEQVRQKLITADIKKASLCQAMGWGSEEGYAETYRGVDIKVDLMKKVRIEIAVNDEYVNPAVNAILEGAKQGKAGDGKVFVVALEQCYRIRNGEKGKTAIG